MVGIYAAGLGMHVTLTEHRPPLAAAISSVPYNVDGSVDYGWIEEHENQEPPRSDILLNLIRKNVEQNQHVYPSDSPEVEELDWTMPHQADALSNNVSGGFDLIIASDVTYVSHLHAYLADIVARLLTKPDSKCWIAHQQRVVNLRGDDFQLESFVNATETAGLDLRVLNDANEVCNADEKVKILEIRSS